MFSDYRDILVYFFSFEVRLCSLLNERSFKFSSSTQEQGCVGVIRCKTCRRTSRSAVGSCVLQSVCAPERSDAGHSSRPKTYKSWDDEHMELAASAGINE